MSGVRCRASSVMRHQFLQTTSPPKALDQFQANFTVMFFGWSFLKIANIFKSMKNSGCRGNRLEKLEKMHKKINQLSDFKIMLQKLLLDDDPPTKLTFLS